MAKRTDAGGGAPEHKGARKTQSPRRSLPPVRDLSTLRLPALPGAEPTREAPPVPRIERSEPLPVPRIERSEQLPVAHLEQSKRLPAARAETSEQLAALIAERDPRPVIIRGSGKMPVVRVTRPPRRLGPLALPLRLGLVTLTAILVLSALFTVAPLGGDGADAAQGDSPFQALSGAVVWRAGPGFTWYTAAYGDTIESVARRFQCQVGGIYQMNNLLSGQELEVGKAYKIPTDPNYGQYYRPPSYVTNGGAYGSTVYGDHIWNSLAGIPPEGALCGPAPRGSGDYMGNYNLSSFDLKSPNWDSYWVRGFTWYHFGVDMANPAGTPIHAAQAGEVIFAGWDTGGGGWSVKINHCNHLATAYGHMEQLVVKVHDMVNVGDVVGLEGSTGWSTGPHLHFSVQWDNAAVDPMLFYGQNNYNITHFLPDG